MAPRVDAGPQLVRRDLTNSDGREGRRYVRAVRDLAAARFDVDALPPFTPVTVWTIDDDPAQLVAFVVERGDENGGRFAAARVLLDDEEEWVEERGGTLEGPLSTRPVGYRAITSGIGVREHPLRHKRKWHAGTDFAAPIGTPVVAIADGVVLRVSRNWTAGKFLVVEHDVGFETYETRYLHLDRKAKGIEPGVRVKKGDVLGLVGKTGRVTGPHLHYEIRDSRGYPLDAARLNWPAAGALTDARALRELSYRMRLLESDARLVAPPKEIAHHDAAQRRVTPEIPPAVPGAQQGVRARTTPPPNKRRRVLPRKASLFDERDESALADPLVQRAIALAADFTDVVVPGWTRT
jgi:murein DD-endopeptidase MepM/ murein hydrolase activator NlpD